MRVVQFHDNFFIRLNDNFPVRIYIDTNIYIMYVVLGLLCGSEESYQH